MNVPLQTRRANLWMFTGLVIFALILCVVILLWMRATVRAKGGIVDPQRPHAVFYQGPTAPERFRPGRAA